MKVHHTPWRRCPYCGTLHDAATEISGTGEGPDDGSASVCLNCSGVAVFDASVLDGVRVPTDDEAAELYNNVEVVRAVAVTKRARSRW